MRFMMPFSWFSLGGGHRPDSHDGWDTPIHTFICVYIYIYVYTYIYIYMCIGYIQEFTKCIHKWSQFVNHLCFRTQNRVQTKRNFTSVSNWFSHQKVHSEMPQRTAFVELSATILEHLRHRVHPLRRTSQPRHHGTLTPRCYPWFVHLRTLWFAVHLTVYCIYIYMFFLNSTHRYICVYYIMCIYIYIFIYQYIYIYIFTLSKEWWLQNKSFNLKTFESPREYPQKYLSASHALKGEGKTSEKTWPSQQPHVFIQPSMPPNKSEQSHCSARSFGKTSGELPAAI